MIQCFEGEDTSCYDKENAYIEQTIPLTDEQTKQIEGVMLVSTSTGEIVDSIAVLEHRGGLLMLAICVIVWGFWLCIIQSTCETFLQSRKGY